MTEFTPILQSRPARGVERLLGSARIDVPRPGGVARTVAALGLVSGVTATAGASAAAATSSGAAVIVKWLVIGAVAGAAVTGTGEAVRYTIDANREARPAVHQTAAPAAPVRAATASPRAALPDVPAAREEVPAPVTAPDPRGAQTVLKAPASASQPTLSEEVRALDAVRQLMAAGDARGALRALDDFSRRFREPRLGPEAALLREQAHGLVKSRDPIRPIRPLVFSRQGKMKTAGVGSTLSMICVGFASACSSPVSIGHNDNKAVTADSGQQGGQGQPLGTGGQGTAWVNMGTSSSGVAGQATGGQAGQATSPAWQWPILGAAFEGDGSSPEPLPPNAECVPLDPTGADAHTWGWGDLAPGIETQSCGTSIIETAIDIVAVHSVNSPGVVRSWVGLLPLIIAPTGCGPPPPGTFLYTADVTEQITVFNTPIHANAGEYVATGEDITNKTNQFSSGEETVFLLPNAPPSLVPCALHGALVGVDASQDLNPGDESTICMRLTLAEPHDVFLVRVWTHAGVLDSVLSFGDPTGPDGTGTCDETADASTPLAIVKDAATVEAKPRDAHMLAGQQVVLRVHAVNVTNRVITGEASARIF